MTLNREEIDKIIPHRAPMLLVDRITSLTDEEASGELDVREDAMFVQGHFPGNPVMPAVFELEAIAQVGAVAILSRPEFRGKTAYYASIDKAKFRRMVRPGDILRMTVRLTKIRGAFAVAEVAAYVGDELAAQAEIKCAVSE